MPDCNDLIRQGSRLAAQKKFDEALEIFKQASKSIHCRLNALMQMAQIQINSGRFDDAIQNLKTAHLQAPDNANVLNNLGVLLYKVNQLDESETQLSQAIGIDSTYVDALYNLGKVYSAQNKMASAVHAFQTCLNLQPSHTKVPNLLSDIFASKDGEDKWQNTYRSILVVMDEGIGNMIMLTPMLKALKSWLPDACITVIGRQPSIQVIDNWECVDHVLTEPSKAKYDLCFLTLWSQNFQNKNQSWLKTHCHEVIKGQLFSKQHESDSSIELLKCVGFQGEKPSPYCSVKPVKVKVSKQKKKVALSDTTLNHPAWLRKRWPYYKELAKELQKQGYEILLIGGHVEAEQFKLDEWPQGVHNLMGKYTIPETASILEQCNLFIGNDSGPAHMAAALGIPTFVFFGSTLISKNLPLGKSVTPIRVDLNCSPCQYLPSWQFCSYFKCMKELTLDKVLPIIFSEKNEQASAIPVEKEYQPLQLINKDYGTCQLIEEDGIKYLQKNNIREPLRIHLVGAARANYPWGMENEILRAIKLEGIEIVETDYRLDQRQFQKAFMRPAHIMLVCKGSGIPPQLIHQYPGKTILWYQDDVFTTEHAPRDLAFNGPAFDLVYTFDQSAIQEYHSMGLQDVHYLPLAMSPALHRKMYVEKKYDVGFVGNIHPNRKPFFERLSKKFNVFVARAFMDDMVKIFNESKIVLNLGIGPTGIQQRVFETLGCGSFLLTNEIPESDRLFKDKTHLVYFNEKNIDDLIQYYLDHEDEREQIAQFGYVEANKKHTFQHRIKQIIQQSIPIHNVESKVNITKDNLIVNDVSDMDDITGMFETISCPYCGGHGKGFLAALGGVLRQCQTCKLIYASPRLKKEALRELYTNYLPSVYVESDINSDKYKKHHAGAERDVDRIEKYRKPGKVLDVGAAAGTFLHYAKKRGWEVIGTELSKVAINFAKQKYGVNLIEGELLDIQLPECAFDAIAVRHCIEHFRQPIRELEILHKALKSKGLLYVTTPEHAKDMGVLIKNHQLPHHLVNFTKETLTKMLNKTGFDVLEYESYPSGDSEIENMCMIAQKQ